MTIHYLKGSALEPVGDGRKLIIHVCNDVKAWGKGFVLEISKRWKKPEEVFRSTVGKLGTVQYVKVEDDITVGNMIAMHRIGDSALRYHSLVSCLQDVAQFAKDTGCSIHAPKFGCGLAGSKWSVIEPAVQKAFKGLEVHIYTL